MEASELLGVSAEPESAAADMPRSARTAGRSAQRCEKGSPTRVHASGDEAVNGFIRPRKAESKGSAAQLVVPTF